MALARRTSKATRLYGYTVDEVARFLQYDREAVRYWLRTGHLEGRYDERLGDWRVTANELVAFLRQTSEPMPTGVVGAFGEPEEALVISSGRVETATLEPARVGSSAGPESSPSRVRTQEPVLPAC